MCERCCQHGLDVIFCHQQAEDVKVIQAILHGQLHLGFYYVEFLLSCSSFYTAFLDIVLEDMASGPPSCMIDGRQGHALLENVCSDKSSFVAVKLMESIDCHKVEVNPTTIRFLDSTKLITLLSQS